MPQDSELHMAFSIFSPLGEWHRWSGVSLSLLPHGMLGIAEGGCLAFLGQLSSVNTPSGYSLLTVFLLWEDLVKKIKCSGIIQNYSCPHPCLMPRGFLVQYLLWKTDQASEGKSHNIVGHLYDWGPLSFKLPELSILNL